jgi:hypothetical protein
MNRSEAQANNRAIDSLINYETVKYCGNEEHEVKRYDECMHTYQVGRAQFRSGFCGTAHHGWGFGGALVGLWQVEAGGLGHTCDHKWGRGCGAQGTVGIAGLWIYAYPTGFWGVKRSHAHGTPMLMHIHLATIALARQLWE